jgi:hypothetical protein
MRCRTWSCSIDVSSINQRRQLSGDALAALKDFYGERDERQKRFENLKSQAEDDFEGKLSMDAFTEDWNASQFWYNDETATTLARQLLDGATDDTKIAVVSAPSAFIQLKNLLVSIFARSEYRWLIMIRHQTSTSAGRRSSYLSLTNASQSSRNSCAMTSRKRFNCHRK